MDLIHEVSFQVSSVAKRELHEAGLEVDVGFAGFQILDTDPRWPRIRRILDRVEAGGVGVGDYVSTRFSKAETDEADWLALDWAWHWGYPQPEDPHDEFLRRSCSLQRYCVQCGAGAKQVAPYRFKAEPRWGRHEMMQAHWLDADFFVTPQLYADVFRGAGVECTPVVHHATGRPLKSVVQLRLPGGDCAMELDGWTYRECASCRVYRYEHPQGRPFPRFLSRPTREAFHTREIFGYGATGPLTIISSRVYRALMGRKLRDVRYWPVMPVGAR